MRIAHLSRARGPADGGISLAVEDLVDAQRHHWRKLSGEASPGPIGWFTPPARLGRELQAFRPQLLHVHGLWSAPNRLLVRCRPGPAVIAPHGMLDPWALAQSRRRKRLAWLLFEAANLRRAGAIQALTRAEAAAVRCLLPAAPIAVIANGVALPPAGPVEGLLPPPPWAGAIPAGDRVLLFLSRFHAKKGLAPLLTAWQTVQSEAARHGWRLVLVGYGDGGALADQVAAAQHRGELRRVMVLGPCFGAEKAAVLAAASAFVLPSYSEGLPMAALEAMAHRLPCLLSAACNLPEAFSAGAALPAEPDPAALAIALRHLFALSPAERAAMGAAGRALVAARYSWPRVAQQTAELYRWVLGGGQRPGFVEVG